MKSLKIIALLLLTTLLSCSNEQELIETKAELANNKTELASRQVTKEGIRCVTYNFHGGHTWVWTNTRKFRELLNGEDIIFMQEVKPEHVWIVKIMLRDYKYTYYSEKKATKPGKNKREGILTLSKYPLVVKHEKIIQIDPQVDKWERKAQHVAIDVNGKRVNFFHYHNTYNFNENNFASEREGMKKFAKYALDRLDATSIQSLENTVFLGDYNVFKWHIKESLPTRFYKGSFRDHINTNMRISKSGIYDTARRGMSDHNAIWAVVNL